MTDPQHASATDNGRYYIDPLDGRQMISVTNTLDQHAISALAPAAAKVTAEYIVEHLSEANRAAAAPDDLDEFVKVAKRAYRDAWDKRAELGSRIHHMAEGINLGAPIVQDDEAEPFVDSYLAFLHDFGIRVGPGGDIVAAECTVLHRSNVIPYGGTSDIWANLRFDADTSPLIPKFKPRAVPPDPLPTPSGLWLIDIKTSLSKPASAVYEANVMQLAALRHAEVALICPPECRWGEAEYHDASHEFPLPEFVGAAVLNLRTNGYGFVPLPADEHAFDAFRGLLHVARYVHGLDLRGYKPIQSPTNHLKDVA
ncbi:hypothetical protein [Streptosporangium canum]|uniref:hypothetical protein n=1 Tax=Streptosporangium canum TaxID=324952 RepID=UPI003799272A